MSSARGAWIACALLGGLGALLLWRRALPVRRARFAAAGQEDVAPDGTPLEHYAG